MRHPACFFIVCLSAASLAQPAVASPAADTVDIDHLIAAYHQAVLGHDGARLAALFVPDGSAWFSVLSDASLVQIRAKTPNTPKIRIGSAKAFAQLVSTTKAKLDPQHSNLQVRSDGAVGTVSFDFRFMIDGREQNRGSESWQLVKGLDGWRIASIVYSSTPSNQ
jgi:hypothetical protein